MTSLVYEMEEVLSDVKEHKFVRPKVKKSD